MTLDELNVATDKKRGKAGGWPANLQYRATEQHSSVSVTITDVSTGEADVWKAIDPWGFAFLDQVLQLTNKRVEMKFQLKSPDNANASFKYEALKRRLSYLSATNNLKVELEKGSIADTLYSIQELSSRPDAEVVRDDFCERGHEDKVGRLEKDFQTYLFGKGKDIADLARTNERLALFGPDFLRVGKVKGGYAVEREFPTGAFSGEIKDCNRILPTEYVDLVTLNRYGHLSVIEIKFDDAPLEVIPQVLNYALFFHSYRSKLNPSLSKRFGEKAKTAEVVTYLVSNVFHNRFSSVWKYYTNGDLTLKQVIMGHTPQCA